MIIFELVLLGDFNRNKNNLEENQGFVKLSAKPQLGRNEFFALFSGVQRGAVGNEGVRAVEKTERDKGWCPGRK